jgi:hypothetical protein
MLIGLALFMPDTVMVLEVAVDDSAAPVWAVKLKASGLVSTTSKLAVTALAVSRVRMRVRWHCRHLSPLSPMKALKRHIKSHHGVS